MSSNKGRTKEYSDHLERLSSILGIGTQAIANILETSLLLTASESRTNGSGFSPLGEVKINFDTREIELVGPSDGLSQLLDPEISNQEILEVLSNAAGNR